MQTNHSGNRAQSVERRLVAGESAFATEELPLSVRDAATYLGVSVQTVYLWVERKQIPHLRVMGRNIRFLKSDLRPFRATFKQEIGNGKTE
jgi:excisionase family DNA binding protein